MLIAISVKEATQNTEVEPSFGRCPYFLILDSESMDMEFVENPNVSASSGAGIQTAGLLADKGVHTVLTGNCGPKAYSALNSAGIEVVTDVSGQVKQVIEQYKSDSPAPSTEPNAPGMQPPEQRPPAGDTGFPGKGSGQRGGGRGQGGRGRGGGGGKGMGGGQGRRGRGQGQGRGQGRGR